MNQASELLQEDSQFIDEESHVGTINASWNFHYAMAQPWQRKTLPYGSTEAEGGHPIPILLSIVQ